MCASCKEKIPHNRSTTAKHCSLLCGQKARQAKYRNKHRSVVRNLSQSNNWKRYGISFTHEQYQAMYKRQGGVCAVCKRPPTTVRLAVDHDHQTKKIRGLLCRGCNRLAVDVRRIRQILQYLEVHEESGL